MKKFFSLILAIILILCSCTPDIPTVSSSEETVSQVVSSEEITSSETVSEVDLTQFLWKEIDGEKYYDIKVAKEIYGTKRGDASALFIEEADAYYVEDGIYFLDAETMRRVVKKKFKGNGSIKWHDYREDGTYNGIYQFDGVLPVSKVNDPLFVSTCLPNEQSSYMQTTKSRHNAAIMYTPVATDTNIMTIGAVYLNDEMDIPDNTRFTVCLGRMTCLIKFKGEDKWTVVSDLPKPEYPNNLYYLPWGNFGIRHVPMENMHIVDDHYEVTLTAADLKALENPDVRVDGACLHFWGERYFFEDASQIEGIVSSYEIWVKEPQYSGYLTAAIGADLRDRYENIHQAFSGINFSITDKKRVVFAHNVAPEIYDEVMDSEWVQKTIGLK